MNKTSIAWTDFTSNALRATNVETGFDGHYCEKVSPGCLDCYASDQNARGRYPRASTGIAFPWHPAAMKQDPPSTYGRLESVPPHFAPSRVVSTPEGDLRLWLNRAELQEWVKQKYAGKRIFVFDMTDLFGEWVPDAWLLEIFAAIAISPATFQILTKRPERARDFLWSLQHPAGDGLPGTFSPDMWPLRNLWLGITGESQPWFDKRLGALLEAPAAVHFLSYEPAEGPLSIEGGVRCWCGHYNGECEHQEPGLDWVIAGGKTGNRPRAIPLEWARSVRDQCEAAGIPFFMKQIGGKRTPDDRLESLPEDLRVRAFPA